MGPLSGGSKINQSKNNQSINRSIEPPGSCGARHHANPAPSPSPPCCSGSEEEKQSWKPRWGKKLEEHFWGGGRGHSCSGQLRAACPPWRCLSSLFAFHTAAESAWCCESREKNRQEDGGLRAGNREHESSWETLRGLAARGGPRAGDGQQLRLGGGGWRPGAAAPLGSTHSWRKRHFWGQPSAWEKFQGCLWSAAAAGPLGLGAAAGVSAGCLSLWGSGRQRGDTQTCQALRWGPPGLVAWVQPRFGAQAPLSFVRRGCAPREPRLGTWCLGFPSFEPLGAGRGCWCRQRPARAPREAAFPVLGGKSSHVRPATCLQVTSRESPCPCRCHRCSSGATAPPGSEQPRGWALLRSPSQRFPRGPDPAGSFSGAWATSARPASGACAQSGGAGGSPGVENMTKGHACPLRGPLARALPVLGSCPCPPPLSWRGRIVPVPEDVRRRKGWGAALPRSCFLPPVPQHSPAAGTAPALPGPHGRSLSPERGTEGQQHPGAKPCSGHSCASVSPANSTAVVIIGAAPDDAQRRLALEFWGSKPPLQHSPEPRHTGDRRTSPRRSAPARPGLGADFWGKGGVPSAGAPRSPEDVAAPPAPSPQPTEPRGRPQPPAAASRRSVQLRFRQPQPMRSLFPSANAGALAAPTAPRRGFVRPEQSPFPASPSPCPAPCRGGGARSLPALPQGGKPPAHRCHRPRVAWRAPLLRDGEKLWRVLPCLALSRDVGRGRRRRTLLLPVPALLWPSLRGRQECAAGSHRQHEFLFLAPLLAPREPPPPLQDEPRGTTAAVLGEKGIWGRQGAIWEPGSGLA